MLTFVIAFTGADSEREGFFQAANGGTLFLDEVADLPLAMQVKLLRALQEKRVRKVGSVTEEAVDLRVICATHRNLKDCVDKGVFRQDLYYRLNVIELRMPPLRERMEDIPVLVDSLLLKLVGEGHPRLSEAAKAHGIHQAQTDNVTRPSIIRNRQPKVRTGRLN